MAQNTNLRLGDRVYLGTVTSRKEDSRGLPHDYPCLISTEIRTLLQGRYAEFGEPTFHKIPRAPPSGLSRVKLSFSRRSNARTGMAYEFNYSESTLPEGVTEDALFGELTRQVREVLLKDRVLESEYIAIPVRHHQYILRARRRRFRDDDEAKLRIAYACAGLSASRSRNAEDEGSNDLPVEIDQEIEKVAVQARYWSCNSNNQDEAAASTER